MIKRNSYFSNPKIFISAMIQNELKIESNFKAKAVYSICEKNQEVYNTKLNHEAIKNKGNV